MKIALIALAALVPALASAEDPAPYVVHEGRAAGAAAASAGKNTSSFGTNAVHPSITKPGSSSKAAAPSGAAAAAPAAAGARSFRGVRRSSRRGITGSTPPGGSIPTPTPAPSDTPGFATPGAKIISAGIQPTYSDPHNTGVHIVDGGGFVAMDQSRATNVGGAGISWAPPDTPPSANPTMGGNGGGSGGSSNGRIPNGSGGAAPAGGPQTAPTKNRGDSGPGGDGSGDGSGKGSGDRSF